ncbi:hypothetical protein R3P38DRAFT_3178095 [Favolaschia claudopus]|uniref:Uncharacterized protein n=1 Tax=Favolaschia claudopus TaxID=2862362 RepID=A0AAW0D0A0_9AGAR
MRATISIYEDPSLESEKDVWADQESKRTFYVVLAVSIAAVSSVGYVGYQLLGKAAAKTDTGSMWVFVFRSSESLRE